MLLVSYSSISIIIITSAAVAAVVWLLFNSPYTERNKTNHFTENNENHTNPNNLTVDFLDIADGLKELLIKHRYTLEELSRISSVWISRYWSYVAKIICTAARKLSNCNYHNHHQQQLIHYSSSLVQNNYALDIILKIQSNKSRLRLVYHRHLIQYYATVAKVA